MQTIKTRTAAILAAAILAASSLGFATAAGASTDDVAQTRVLYSDLDLQSVDGRKALSHRISRAVAGVCATNDPGKQLEAITCRDQAKNRAYADLQQRGVTLR